MRLNRILAHERREPSTEPAPSASPAAPALRLVPDDPALAAERRLRNAGGPQDSALYRCDCGFIFDAPVSTTVRCPHCDSGVAW